VIAVIFEKSFIGRRFGAFIVETAGWTWGFAKGTSKDDQISVIPAKAGIQSLVISMSYDGLVPGLRREDGVFRSPLNCSFCVAQEVALSIWQTIR
jgi:hypothetical protein